MRPVIHLKDERVNASEISGLDDYRFHNLKTLRFGRSCATRTAFF